MAASVPDDHDADSAPVPTTGDADRRSGLSVIGADGLVLDASPPESTEPAPLSRSRPSLSLPVLHPRGRIPPPLPLSESRARRFLHSVVRLAQGVYKHDDIFHAAPAMAFHFFLSLLPLLAFLGYVLGLVAQSSGTSVVFGLVLQNLPATSKGMLEKEILHLAAADRLGPLAAVGFLWIASGGTQGLMQAIERVVGVPRRAWWRQRLIALAWVLGLLLAVPVASFGIVEWNEVVHPSVAADHEGVEAASGRVEPTPEPNPIPSSVGETRATRAKAPPLVEPPAWKARRFLRSGGERLVTIGISLLVAVGGLAAFYRFAVAYDRRVRRRVLPGALVAVALIIVVSWAFGLYVSTLASYTLYYGSLAAIAVLIIWLWLMSLAILVGAELNSQLEGLRDLDREDESDAPSQTELAPNLEQ